MSIRHGQKIRFRPVRQCECGNHVFVAITKGYVTLVSPEDRDWLDSYSYSALETGGLAYAIKTRLGLLHRSIMRPARHELVDHRNRNGCDNRRENLRICTKQQNSWNSKGRTALPKGVSRWRHKWRARLGDKHLGVFETTDEASAAYEQAARGTCGEFICLQSGLTVTEIISK